MLIISVLYVYHRQINKQTHKYFNYCETVTEAFQIYGENFDILNKYHSLLFLYTKHQLKENELLLKNKQD